MRGLLLKLTFLGLLLLPAAFAVAAELSVQLRTASATFKQGHLPRFIVTIQNAANSTIKVVDVVKRSDLKDAYARFSVTESGKPVKVPIAISDPGPISEGDLLTLSPMQALTFEHSGFPLGLDRLRPGSYEAKLVFYPNVGSSAVTSNTVSFRVIQ